MRSPSFSSLWPSLLLLMSLTVSIGWIVDRRQQAGYSMLASWSPMFDAIAVGLLVGAAAWLLVDATRSIVPRPTRGFDVITAE